MNQVMLDTLRSLARRFVPALLLLGVAGLFVSCGNSIQLFVLIYDPCDGEAALEASDHIKIDVFDVAGDVHEDDIWGYGDGEGELSGVSLTEQAVITVLGLQSDGAGSPNEDAVVAATTIGILDLSGADGESSLQVDVFLGKVGEFHNTSYFEGEQRACSRTQAERWGHSATLLQDGRVFLVGGIRPVPQTGGQRTWWNTTEFYNPVTGGFDSGPDLKWSRRNHTATLLDDGRVLVCGGEYLSDDDADPLTPEVVQVSQVAQLIDLAEGTTSTVMMAAQRTDHTATLLDDGRVLLAGGKGKWGAVLETTEILDPVNQTTISGPTLLQGRANHGAVGVSATQVALVGGQGAAGTLQATEFVDLNRSSGFECQPAGACDLAVGRSHVVAAVVPGSNGVIAVAGGFTDSVTSPEFGAGVDNIDLIQLNMAILENSTVVSCPAPGAPILANARGAAAFAELDDGLLIVGGVSENAGVVLGSAEVLRVTDITAPGCGTNSTATADGLSNPRAEAVITPLLGDDLLITGGFAFSVDEPIAVGQGEVYVRHRR